jgi:hypothetical protein
MTLVEVYSKDDCHLCDEATALLEKVRKEIPFTLKIIKLIPGEGNFEEYKEDFPVIHINKRLAYKHRLHEATVRIRLQQIADDEQRESGEDEAGSHEHSGGG